MKTEKNKYAMGAKISGAQFKALAQLFSRDISAVEIAGQTGLNRNTVNRYTQALRKRIMTCFGELPRDFYLDEAPVFYGVKADNKKILVEPIGKKHDGSVSRLICGKPVDGNDENIKKWREYDGLISTERGMQIYLNFGKTVRTSQPENITAAEDFFIYVKERMGKFYGIPKKHLPAHLKECEFRYNNRGNDIYGLLMRAVRETPLFAGEE